MKQYSVLWLVGLDYWDIDHDQVYHHPSSLLCKILQDPRIAYYPVKLQIADCSYDADDDDDDDDYASRTKIAADAISAWGSKISALVADNPWLSDEARRAEWRDALLDPTNQSHHLAIILTMLPSLEQIIIGRVSDPASKLIKEMVWAITTAKSDVATSVHGKALPNLLEISLDGSDTRYGEDFTMYAPFTALPSMRSVHGYMLRGNFFQRDFRPKDNQGLESPRPSQIEEIYIVYSAIDLLCWDWMLSTIENLKRFTYHHGQGIEGFRADYEPTSIVALLKKYARHSLRRLDLTADQDTITGSYDSETDMWTAEVLEASVGDLKGFRTLRVVRLDDTAFQKPEEGQIVPLIDVLPASIRVVRLLREIKQGDPADLFVGLAGGKKEKLPELKKIALEGNYILREDLIDKCKAVGIEITGPCLKINPVPRQTV
ncbi:MAG: hypothetical protein LQ338_008032 [Usnochroma carphineum]|nr:MAG: hypothetical protein LQ338_008032 [Usnochroma carphineum]